MEERAANTLAGQRHASQSCVAIYSLFLVDDANFFRLFHPLIYQQQVQKLRFALTLFATYR